MVHTITWDMHENINIQENGLAINPFTSKLYAIGMDTKSEISNLLYHRHIFKINH